MSGELSPPRFYLYLVHTEWPIENTDVILDAFLIVNWQRKAQGRFPFQGGHIYLTDIYIVSSEMLAHKI